jgi:hypothetical protein
MAPPVKLVRVNGLQYNRNRDPQAYRRTPGVPFRIQALTDGKGAVRITLRDADGAPLASADVDAPGTWTHEVRYDTPGTRLLQLEAARGGDRFSLDLRLDVEAPAHH